MKNLRYKHSDGFFEDVEITSTSINGGSFIVKGKSNLFRSSIEQLSYKNGKPYIPPKEQLDKFNIYKSELLWIRKFIKDVLIQKKVYKKEVRDGYEFHYFDIDRLSKCIYPVMKAQFKLVVETNGEATFLLGSKNTKGHFIRVILNKDFYVIKLFTD